MTPGEDAVIQRLRRLRIATLRTLRQSLGCCHMTVARALKKTGHHHRFNANAAYYALPQTAVFDADGLWFHRQIGFSQHGNLLQTLVALVERSPGRLHGGGVGSPLVHAGGHSLIPLGA